MYSTEWNVIVIQGPFYVNIIEYIQDNMYGNYWNVYEVRNGLEVIYSSLE
jgi:hypothetical protein